MVSICGDEHGLRKRHLLENSFKEIFTWYVMETMVQSQNVVFINWNQRSWTTDFNSSNLKKLMENYQKAMNEMIERNSTQEMLCPKHVRHTIFRQRGS